MMGVSRTGQGLGIVAMMAALTAVSGCMSLDYENAALDGRVTAYESFVQRYPQGEMSRYAGEAAARLRELQSAYGSETDRIRYHWLRNASSTRLARVVLQAPLVPGRPRDDANPAVSSDFNLVTQASERGALLACEFIRKTASVALPEGAVLGIQFVHGVRDWPGSRTSSVRVVFERQMGIGDLRKLGPGLQAQDVLTRWRTETSYESMLQIDGAGGDGVAAQYYLALKRPLPPPPPPPSFGPGPGHGPGPGPHPIGPPGGHRP